MRIPAIAEELCLHYARAFDKRHPGLLTGLYLVGSIALDDFQRDCSDVDFLAVTRRPVGLDEVAPIHAAVFRAFGRPFFDGLYVTEEELRRVPDAGSRGIAIIDGVPVAESAAERHAVTWLTLARHGITVRGSVPKASWIAADLVAAQAHSRQNLQRYWLGWIASHRLASTLSADDVAWSVLGISRLHGLICEGMLLSKTGAAHYALRAFPRHRSIIQAALAAREACDDCLAVSPESRRALFAFLDDIFTDAAAR